MTWTEVFKINSDITKPLNELILEHRTVAAADTPLKVLVSEPTLVSWPAEEFGRFTANVDGTVRILLRLIANSTKEFFSLDVQDEEATVLHTSMYLSTVQNNAEYFSSDMNVKKGTTYTVKLSWSGTTSSSPRPRCHSLAIGGIVTDITLIS